MRLTRSVCPSVCGWNAVLIARSMSSDSANFLKNTLLNLVSRSLMMRCGTPCNRTTSFINNRANIGAVIFILHGARCTIFVYLSTNTHIALYSGVSRPLPTLGNDVRKSTVITCHRRVGISIDCSKPTYVGWCLCLPDIMGTIERIHVLLHR